MVFRCGSRVVNYDISARTRELRQCEQGKRVNFVLRVLWKVPDGHAVGVPSTQTIRRKTFVINTGISMIGTWHKT